MTPNGEPITARATPSSLAAALPLTPAQRLAVSCREEPLLVSAAAGSGKTTVLCERILARLREEEDFSLDNILVVTFTRSAASQLRAKLSEKLRAEVTRDPGNARVRRELSILPRARIGTIHSFCFTLLRQNFAALGISPAFRVIEQGEAKTIALAVMEDIVDEFYEGTHRARFERLSDMISPSGDDTLAQDLLGVYSRLQSERRGIALLSDTLENLRAADSEMSGGGGDFFKTDEGKLLQKNLLLHLEYYRKPYEEVLSYIGGLEGIDRERAEKKYGEAFRDDYKYLKRMIAAAGEGYAALQAAICDEERDEGNPEKRKWEVLGRGGKKIDGCDQFKDTYRKNFKEKLDLCSPRTRIQLGISFPPEGLRDAARAAADLLETLSLVLRAFDRRYSDEKKRLSALDFADAERRCVDLLLYPNTENPTQVARQIASSLREVYIDEYQDVNELQDAIFRAVAPERRFMVGDIKQSIYRFRGARPSVFRGYRERFTPVGEDGKLPPNAAGSTKGATIFLSDNFRSDSSVIRFVNDVFASLFPRSGDFAPEDAIPYDKPDRLIKGKQGDKNLPVELWLVDKHLQSDLTVKDSAADTSPSEDKSADADDPAPDDAAHAKEIAVKPEAALVAAIASDLIAGGRAPEEICVLVQKNDLLADLDAAFRARKIPLSQGRQVDFYSRPEILLLHAILRAIDNPMRDTDLVAVLRSPLFGFTLTDLADLRGGGGGSYYGALCRRAGRAGKIPAEAGASADGSDPADESDLECYLDDDDTAATPILDEDGEGETEAPTDSSVVDEPLCTALLEKCNRLLDFLSRERRKCRTLSLDKLILQIESEYSLLPMMTAGLTPEEADSARTALLAYERSARAYAVSGGSLSGFLNLVEDQKKAREKESDRGAGLAPQSGKVRAMTVHSAKGLEFPVVIYYGGLVNLHSEKGSRPYVFDSALGLALTLPDKTGYGKIDPPRKKATELKDDFAELAEQMRLVYVALTRAKEKLILTGRCSRSNTGTYLAKMRDLSRHASVLDYLSNRNVISWVLLALGDKIEDYTVNGNKEALALGARLKEASPAARPTGEIAALSPEDRSRLDERLSFVYPYRGEVGLPAKLSASRLWPDILDEDAARPEGEPGGDGARYDFSRGGKRVREDLLRARTSAALKARPRFLSEKSSRASAAERGTATHVFMQFCSFASVRAHGVAAECKRLVERRFLTQEVADLVDQSQLETFFASDLFREMERAERAGHLYREQRFNILLPAAWFTEDEGTRARLGGERLLVQGVIDCFFESAPREGSRGELVLLDYKTDRVTDENALREAHRQQMVYYNAALEQIYRRPADRALLWSFFLGREVAYSPGDIAHPDLP